VYLHVKVLDGCAQRTRGVKLVRTKRPYVQFMAARVIGTKFVVGVQMVERGSGSQVSMGSNDV
jgi:hypothetical protein